MKSALTQDQRALASVGADTGGVPGKSPLAKFRVRPKPKKWGGGLGETPTFIMKAKRGP